MTIAQANTGIEFLDQCAGFRIDDEQHGVTRRRSCPVAVHRVITIAEDNDPATGAARIGTAGVGAFQVNLSDHRLGVAEAHIRVTVGARITIGNAAGRIRVTKFPAHELASQGVIFCRNSVRVGHIKREKALATSTHSTHQQRMPGGIVESIGMHQVTVNVGPIDEGLTRQLP